MSRAPGDPRIACITCGAPLTTETAYANKKSRSGLQSRCKRCDNAVRCYGLAEIKRRLARGEELIPRGERTGPGFHKRGAQFIRDDAGNLVRVR